jgi:hypothetical protein
MFCPLVEGVGQGADLAEAFAERCHLGLEAEGFFLEGFKEEFEDGILLRSSLHGGSELPHFLG